MPGKKKKYNARFPPARIKKIMQSDEEVGKVAAAVPVIISRALELFVENMLKKANEVTSRRGARTLTPSHLKFCINSESRFDFLKEIVSGVPDLQGDMDINLDLASTSTTVGEASSPTVATPSTLTTSSLTWPSRYSAGSSNTLPSNISATTAVQTSSVLESLATSTHLAPQQHPNTHFEKNTNKNNNTSMSRIPGSYHNEGNLDKSHKERNDLESKNQLNTKVVRKRGRPRKLSNDVQSYNKPKKSKTSQEGSLPGREILPGLSATQYSLSHQPHSGNIHSDPDVKVSTKLDKETKSLIENANKKLNSFSKNSAEEMQRQISRTYSTGSIPSPTTSSPSSSTNSTIPSFTLTFPILSQNTENDESASTTEVGKLKNITKPSSQIEIKQPKLKNNSKESAVDSNSHHTAIETNHTTSNNGFPFTISNILEKELRKTQTIITADTRDQSNTKSAEKGHEEGSDNDRFQYGSEKNQDMNINTVQKMAEDKTSGRVPEKATFPTISWTMNVVAPKIDTSEEIDEDYDA